ncbi:MAG: Crp/Fnr family transcriptional regulator [Desulfobulbus propionicus]|nr:MAG: Crp/Fnr family transcriptional regulator [Desulfobulbus propionicus]
MKLKQGFRDAIFVVTEEEACPIYNRGEEFVVDGGNLTVPEAKPVCLNLTQELLEVVSTAQSLEHLGSYGVQKNRFHCGGCTGELFFEYKRKKGFSTMQMKLLAVAEQRERMRHVDKFYDLLRTLDIFEPLNEDNLSDLCALLELKEYGQHKVILKKGEPGTSLYIIIEGEVNVIGDDGQVLSEMGVGDVFGEMSLLSGGEVTTSIYSKERTKLATLSSKNFKHVLNKFPVLQVFFYRLLVERAQINTLRAGTINSGMTGKLSDIHPVELFQLINGSGKTGRIDLVLENGKAEVFFNKGEIVQASYNDRHGKDAFFYLVSQAKGEFIYMSDIPEEVKGLEPIGGFMGLVMEGMRRVDEEKAE